MPESFNWGDPETPKVIASITKSMSEYKDLKISRDDLYEKSAQQVPDDFEVKYSINEIGNNNPFLLVKFNGEEKKSEGRGRAGSNPNDFNHNLEVNIGDLVVQAGFKEERLDAQPTVKSGIGRITIRTTKV